MGSRTWDIQIYAQRERINVKVFVFKEQVVGFQRFRFIVSLVGNCSISEGTVDMLVSHHSDMEEQDDSVLEKGFLQLYYLHFV